MTSNQLPCPSTRVLTLFGRSSLGLLLIAGAAAQVSPLGPFVGAQFEGFESQHTQQGGQHPPGGAPILIGGLFDGTASLSATSSPFLVQVHGGSSSVCASSHRTGSFQAGSFLCELSLVFDNDQAAFGGYFTSDTIEVTNSATREWEVEFLDSLGMVLGGDSLVLNAPCGSYQWAGWTLPQGTRRIDFASTVPSMSLLMEDLVTSPMAPIGEVTCSGVETSLEQRAQCGASGSASVADNSLTLHASMLPTNTFGFFIVSQSPGFVANPGGSSGNLCLAGAVGRYVGAGQIQNSGVGGAFSLPVDLLAIPQPTGPVTVVAGERWYFQAWFRDVRGGGAVTSNFTGALAIQFE